MARPLRLDPVDGWHHAMNRGVNRSIIFFSDDDRLLFGRLLEDAHERFAVQVHAYCLMDNHFHLLLRCPDGRLSDAMHHVQSVFARTVNGRVGRVGHLFGARFVSRLITTHRYIANVVRYIHRNPLDMAGIARPDQYRWSSHRHYLHLRPKPDWLYLDPISQWFDDSARFDSFVGDEFRSPPTTSSRTCVDPVSLLEAIAVLLRERSNAGPRHLMSQRRAVALALLPALSELEAADLLAALELAPGSDALRAATNRARHQRRDQPVIGVIVDHLTQLFDIDTSAAA